MIVAVIPDRFRKNQLDIEKAGASGSAMSTGNVRRPTRGIQLKNDTYATLKVLRGNGTEIALVNAGAKYGGTGPDGKMMSTEYSNFLIQSVSEDRMEKQQIVETFGEAFIFFFGERPRVLNIQGVLLNTFDFNWEAEWWHNYENYLRGTKCVEHDARVYLTYDDTLVSGYIISTSSGKNSQERNHVGFNFQLFVTDYTQLSKVGDPSADQAKKPMYAGLRSKILAQVASGPHVLRYKRPNWQQKGLSTFSLVESLMSTGISAVRTAMSTAREMANAALLPAAYLDRFIGNPVRVPIGFAGAVALDETRVDLARYLTENIKATGLDNPVAYTTFADNKDEFVDATQYQGSTLQVSEVAQSSFAKGSSVGASATLDKAMTQWREKGLIPPNDAISNMLSRVAANPLGMMVVGSARNWLATKGSQVSSAAHGAIDQVAPVAAGAQAVMGTVAVADNLVGAVSPQASVAVDRSLNVGPLAVQASATYGASVQSIEQARREAVNTFKNFSNNSAGSYIGGG